jgi:hypothetical protein
VAGKDTSIDMCDDVRGRSRDEHDHSSRREDDSVDPIDYPAVR